MGVLWKLAGQMLEGEAVALARLAELLVGCPDMADRQAMVAMMLDDLTALREEETHDEG